MSITNNEIVQNSKSEPKNSHSRVPLKLAKCGITNNPKFVPQKFHTGIKRAKSHDNFKFLGKCRKLIEVEAAAQHFSAPTQAPSFG